MKIQTIALILGVLISTLVIGQTELPLTLKTETGNIEGTLIYPSAPLPVPVVLIIAGSGPTDRNGNSPMMTNNSLKMLAIALANNGIASLRYDKRGIAQSKSAGLKENDLRFQMYVDDAVEWLKLLKNEISFNQIVVIGHSEGSLIGMIASQDARVNQFISLEGAGLPADQIIREQMKSQPPAIMTQSTPILDELVKGNTVENIPPNLNALFRTSVQPYMISWFKFDPQKEIAKLKKPVLIVQGTTDIQVSIDDANRLHAANPGSKLTLIEGMNHVLKNAEADQMKNMLTYRQPDLPLNIELAKTLSDFIQKK
jgi:pimeloyl-ACP methyl ester carboxylesterase